MVEGVATGVLAHVELAQQHRTGFLQLGDHRGVLFGDEILVNGRAVGSPDAFGEELVLYRHRYSMHRTQVAARGYFLLSLAGLRQRLFATHGDV